MIEFPRFMGRRELNQRAGTCSLHGASQIPALKSKNTIHMNYMEVLTMATNFKKKLFKDYLKERRNEHIEAIKSNVYTGAYTVEEAKPLLKQEQIAYSMYQQYKLSQVLGGVKIGKSLFIRNKDLNFVTYDYLHDEIEAVINEIDLQEVMHDLQELIV